MLWLICIFFVSCGFAEEFDVCGGQNLLVEGVIHPLTGSVVLHETDLVAKGAQSIYLERHYSEGWFREEHQGWKFLPQARVQVTNGNPIVVRVTEANGMTVDFRVRKDGTANGELVGSPFGISNCGLGLPSGKYDLRNTEILLGENGRSLVVYSPSGVIRHYKSDGNSSSFYYLEKEVLMNGKVLRYEWNQDHLLSKIESLDPQEKYVYASIAMKYVSDSQIQFTASSQTSGDYHCLTGKCNASFLPMLSSVSTPFFRNETLRYDSHHYLQSFRGKKEVFSCTLTSTAYFSDQHARVSQLWFPVGENDQFVPVHDLHYNLPEAGKQGGTTYVKHCDGTGTTYFFSPELLLTAIQYFGKNGELLKQQNYVFDEDGWLESEVLTDAKSQLIYSRSFEYDSFGNPVLEIFSGSLTGENLVESYMTRRVFSQDGKHLLLQEETEDGPITSYEYLAETDLITKKIVQADGKILMLEDYQYDPSYNLIKKVKESSSGQKEITEYILRQSPPYLHMVEWIIEKYEETGEEKLLKKIQLHYDPQGNVCREDYYDANGDFAYTIQKKYNERGDLVFETNPLKEEASYTYDTKGQLITVIPFSRKIQTDYLYDLRGRIKKITEQTAEESRSSSYCYDERDRCYKEIDCLGNPTFYEYDPVIHKVIKTTHPPIISADGEKKEVISQSHYDPIGREEMQIDPNGHVTSFRRNIYGFPIEIIHPHEMKERFFYHKNGKLHRHIAPDGLITEYVYDRLGRIVSERLLSHTTLWSEDFVYNGFYLIEKSDREEFKTAYVYDAAGRKIEENREGKTTAFSYDPLGRVSTVCREGLLWTHYKRDLLGRIVEETQTDRLGTLLKTISYEYDPLGNYAAIHRFFGDQLVTETFKYDGFGRLIEHRDPLNVIQMDRYDSSHINALQQRVVKKTSQDMQGVTTVCIEDANGRKAIEETFDSLHHLLRREKFFYDPCGNLIETQVNTGKKINYFYDGNNRLSTLVKDLGTPHQQIEHYTYTLAGKVATKTIPGGIILSYTYDPLGNLASIYSSDQQIDQLFMYDRLGRLKVASDQVHCIYFERVLDPHGNILEETWNKTWSISKLYDGFDRPVSIQLQDGSWIYYSYDPVFLRAVTRYTANGTLLYSHHFDAYDLSGHLLSESLIGEIGKVEHHYDLNQRQMDVENFYPIDPLFANATHRLTYDASIDSSEFSKPDEQTHLIYNPLDQLIEIEKEEEKLIFTYDPLGRRIATRKFTLINGRWQGTFTHFYLHDGNEMLGTYNEEGILQQLRVPGLRPNDTFSIPVALELGREFYAPIQDVKGKIQYLIDPKSRDIVWKTNN